MSNRTTPHYGLNQWIGSDQFLRTEFNADNEKIDAALHGIHQQTAQVADQKADITALDAVQSTLNASVASLSAATTASIATLRGDMVQGDLWVKLLDYITPYQTTCIDVPVTRVPFLSCWEVRLLFLSGPCGPVKVQLNGETDYRYIHTYPQCNGEGGGGGGQFDYLGLLPGTIHSPIVGRMTSHIPVSNLPPLFYNDNVSLNNSYNRGYAQFNGCVWESLTSIQFRCEVPIPAGARVALIGLRK